MNNENRFDDPNGQQPEDRKVNLGRHKAQCTICKHPNCKEIEEAWLNWSSPAKIEYDYRVSRDALYRHCHALGLFSKRRKNLIRPYERIVERMDGVDFNGANVISALKEIEKLDSAEKASDAAQSADPKPAAQETTAKGSDSCALGGSSTRTLADALFGKAPEVRNLSMQKTY
jgi:hypothetical protein